MKTAIGYALFSFSLLWSSSSFAEATQTTVELPHKVRTYVSANMYSDPNDNLKDQWGFGITSESDTAMGYMSVGGSLTYYNADSNSDVRDIGMGSYARQTDLAFNSYLKVRMPSSYTFFSFYGIAGIALHLIDQKLTQLPEQYQSAYTFGGDYGGGLEIRLSNLYFDARYMKRIAFNRMVRNADTNEITVGIGIEFFTWSLSETALVPKNLKKTDMETY